MAVWICSLSVTAIIEVKCFGCPVEFRSVQSSQVLTQPRHHKPFLTDLTVGAMSNFIPVNLCLGKVPLPVMGAAEIVKSIWLISMWCVCERFPVLFLISSSPASSSLHNRAHLISRRGWRVCGTFGPGCSSHSCLMLKRNHHQHDRPIQTALWPE